MSVGLASLHFLSIPLTSAIRHLYVETCLPKSVTSIPENHEFVLLRESLVHAMCRELHEVFPQRTICGTIR